MTDTSTTPSDHAAEPRTLAAGPPGDAADLLRDMLRIRFFEDETQDLFTRGLMRGSTHLCQGQEAVSVGVCRALRHGDAMTCTYRGHGAVLAMGAPLDRAFGELLGKAEGLCRGKGGSMHLTDVSVGAYGSNAIVGAHLPITVGHALAARHRGTGAVAVAFFGDGATNIGAFHESLNLAAIWRLPAVFVIENNQYGEYSPLAATTPITRLADRAASYGMPGVHVDGNDVVAVRAVAGEAVERARAGDGPTLIEAETYRQSGHSRSDPGTYRPPGELESWLRRDPITLLQDAMVAAGRASSEELSALREEVRQEVAEAARRAIAWPAPDPRTRFEDIYA
ncbi:acetoin:2,6-dichlorophenolindophenol oxidoreductase subunit alpha [Actinomadura sp. NBRC 104412]|uniref:thiamine pyrophosphate-dependent dehydrogenase E1 component subunit alpha n=1 Tax=Actinomadura sp. NBRC 104412 TaxID=3032203 RepID=UPI0024A00AEF|nr:thiamine pyrophosphate-dependent dehydrogenase E1 component subunit alpha [Actinomadura sp. NBRC 104412]GLZ06138.1 acetoin:2,6-dichlorophenolindophenol oxidoreductase subunit alpha [Actinomadura sp. NBRC 104412]